MAADRKVVVLGIGPHSMVATIIGRCGEIDRLAPQFVEVAPRHDRKARRTIRRAFPHSQAFTLRRLKRYLNGGLN